MATPSVRPWQGTALAVIDIIATVLAFLFGLLFLAFQGMISSLLGGATTTMDVNGVQVQGAQGLASLFSSMGMVASVVFIGLGILAIFMTRGAFKGQKWSPILSIVFAVLAIAGALSNFSSSQFLSLAINLFVLYVAIMCVKSPYFNKAK